MQLEVIVTIKGVLHGRTVELADDPHAAEGQRVNVEVVPICSETTEWVENLRRSAEALADDTNAEMDMHMIMSLRKDDRRLPVMD